MSETDMRKSEKVIADFAPYKNEVYENTDLDRLIVYTFLKLQQSNVPLHFDLVTVAAFKLFPGKFAMASFPQYPDTNRTDKAVRRLTDPKRKNWATGNVENGFYLTDLGREIAEEVEYSLSTPKSGSKVIPSGRSRGRSRIDEISDIRNSDLFKQWREGTKASPHEFFAFLKATPYTPKHLLSDRVKELNRAATDTQDTEIISFLSSMTDNFSNLLN